MKGWQIGLLVLGGIALIDTIQSAFETHSEGKKKTEELSKEHDLRMKEIDKNHELQMKALEETSEKRRAEHEQKMKILENSSKQEKEDLLRKAKETLVDGGVMSFEEFKQEFLGNNPIEF